MTIDYDMQNRILHSDFDIGVHKKYFVNYLEIVILEDGKVEYAVPSHQEKLLSLAMRKLRKTREEVVAMCPPEYYYDYDVWLSMMSGAIPVWNDFHRGKANEAQLKALQELKDAELYRGEVVASPVEYIKFNMEED